MEGADKSNLNFFENCQYQFGLNKSPGLVVMGGDSRSEGCGIESWHEILDGHYIFNIDFFVRIVLFV